MEHREIEDAPEPDIPTVTPETTLSPIVKLRVFILLGSMFIAIVGIAFVVPFLPVLASELGATGVALGLIMAAFSISSSVTQPLAGYFSDKLGRKRFLALGMAIYSIGGFLYVAGSSVTDIVLVRFLQGIGGGLIFSVSMAYMGDLAPKGYEGRYMGIYNVVLFSGFGLGPIIGGVLKDMFGMNMPFYGMGILSAIACVLVMLLLPESRAKVSQIEDRAPLTVFMAIIRQKRMQGVMVMRLAVTLSMVPSFVFLPVLMAEEMGSSGIQIGLAITVRTVVSAALQYPFGWVADHYNRVYITIISVLGMAAVVSLIGLSTQFWHVVILFALLGINEALFLPANTAMMLESGRSNGMGSTMGMLNTTMTMGVFIGSLCAGLLVDAVGFKGAFLTVGAIVGVSLAVCVPLLTKTNQEAGEHNTQR